MRHKISVTYLRLSKVPTLYEGTVPKHAQEPHKSAAKFSSLYKIYFCYNRVKLTIPAMCTTRWNVKIRGCAEWGTEQGVTSLEHVLRRKVFKERKCVYWKCDILSS